MIDKNYTDYAGEIRRLASECGRLSNALGVAKGRTANLEREHQIAEAREAELRAEWDDAKRRGNAALFEMMLHTTHCKFLKFLESPL